MSLLDIGEVAGHVKDSTGFHFPFHQGFELPAIGGFQLTKLMVMELAVLATMLLLFVPLAAKVRGGKPVKGRFWNLLEVFLIFLRDQVFRPSLGKKDAAAYTPYLWTLFFFVLFSNLAGMVPFCGSPTGSIAVTPILAGSTLLIVIGTGMIKHGAAGYWLGLVPPMDLPAAIAIGLKPLLFVIEVVALFIKHVVLAIRLFANMFAGHLVLAVLMAFIQGAAVVIYLWFPVTLATIGVSVAINMLELFVAFLQAYIFTFLTSLFIGMSIHQH